MSGIAVDLGFGISEDIKVDEFFSAKMAIFDSIKKMISQVKK